MEEIKWSSSGFLHVLAANILGFGLALAEICQTFGQRQCQEGMACPKPTTQSLHKMSSDAEMLAITRPMAKLSPIETSKEFVVLFCCLLKKHI